MNSIEDGDEAVICFVMRSRASWNMLVPLDNSSFGVQILADVNVALYVALERCVAIPVEEADMTPGHLQRTPAGRRRGHMPHRRCRTLARNGSHVSSAL